MSFSQINQMMELISVDMSVSRNIITQQIMNQMMNLGFLLLSNIPGYDEDELYRQQKWFFNLDDSQKHLLSKNQFNSSNQNYYRGFAPFIPNDPSYKELYEIGLDLDEVSVKEQKYMLYEKTPWPEGAASNSFVQFMKKHYSLMHKLGIQIMSHIAEGLGLNRNFFDKWFIKDTCSTLRIIHYQPRISNLVEQKNLSQEELKLTTPIHTDSGFLTLLSTFNYPGLQVNVGNDVYRSVRPVPKTIVVNLGDMLSRITNGTLKATQHRVLDIGVERYSSPYFFEPHYSAQIPKSIKNDILIANNENSSETNENQSDSEGNFIYGDWVIEKMREFGEFKHLFKYRTQNQFLISTS